LDLVVEIMRRQKSRQLQWLLIFRQNHSPVWHRCPTISWAISAELPELTASALQTLLGDGLFVESRDTLTSVASLDPHGVLLFTNYVFIQQDWAAGYFGLVKRTSRLQDLILCDHVEGSISQVQNFLSLTHDDTLDVSERCLDYSFLSLIFVIRFRIVLD